MKKKKKETKTKRKTKTRSPRLAKRYKRGKKHSKHIEEDDDISPLKIKNVATKFQSFLVADT